MHLKSRALFKSRQESVVCLLSCEIFSFIPYAALGTKANGRRVELFRKGGALFAAVTHLRWSPSSRTQWAWRIHLRANSTAESRALHLHANKIKKIKSFQARARIHFSAARGAAALSLSRSIGNIPPAENGHPSAKTARPSPFLGMEMRFLCWHRIAKTRSKCIKKEGNG